MDSDVAPRSPQKDSRWTFWIKAICISVVLISLIALIRALPLGRLIEELQHFAERLGPWGPIVFGWIYVVAVVALVPASLLTLAAGAVFGLWKGTLVVSLASTTGVAAAFLIARNLARRRVEQRIQQSPKLKAVDQAIGQQGWKIVALLRLSPAVPFTLQNYLYGVTAVSFWSCVLTSWVAMLPGTFLYVYLGSLGSEAVANRETSIGEWAARGLGLLATIIVTIYITRLAKRAMKESVPLEEIEPAREQPVDSSSPRSTALWICAACLALTLAIAATWQKEAILSLIENWL